MKAGEHAALGFLRCLTALGAIVALSCSHAHSVEKAPKGAQESSEAHAERAQPGASLTSPGPEGILRPEAVRAIQAALANKGLPTGHGGTLDAKTRAGLETLQRKANLAQTGLPDRETLRALGLDPDTLLRK